MCATPSGALDAICFLFFHYELAGILEAASFFKPKTPNQTAANLGLEKPGCDCQNGTATAVEPAVRAELYLTNDYLISSLFFASSPSSAKVAGFQVKKTLFRPSIYIPITPSAFPLPHPSVRLASALHLASDPRSKFRNLAICRMVTIRHRPPSTKNKPQSKVMRTPFSNLPEV